MIIPKPFQVVGDLLEAFLDPAAARTEAAVEVAATDKEHGGLLTLEDRGAGGWSATKIGLLKEQWAQSAASGLGKAGSTTGNGQGDGRRSRL